MLCKIMISLLCLRVMMILQGSVWPLGFLMRTCTMLRNRMLADPSFLFKVGTEVGLFFDMNPWTCHLWSY